jgi:hypothetical protein
MILKPGQLPDCEQDGISLGWRNIPIALKMPLIRAPVIDRLYPPSRTADAMACAEEGHARAKIVITFEHGSASL